MHVIKLIAFVVLARGENFACFYCPLPGKKKVFNPMCLFFPFFTRLPSFLFKCYWLLNSGIRRRFVKPISGWWGTETEVPGTAVVMIL